MRGQQVSRDPEQRGLELGGVGDDAAADHDGGAGHAGQRRRDQPAGQRLRDRDRLAAGSQQPDDPPG